MMRSLVGNYANRCMLCAVRGLVVVSLAGCVGSNATTEKTANPTDATQDTHEHFPEHWPYTIFAASKRLNELVQAPDTASSQHAVAPRKEFADLLAWLPVLAADSDLGREAFDRIDAWAQEQSARLAKPNAEKISLAVIVAEKQVQDMVRWLSETCLEEQRRLDQLLH